MDWFKEYKHVPKLYYEIKVNVYLRTFSDLFLSGCKFCFNRLCSMFCLSYNVHRPKTIVKCHCRANRFLWSGVKHHKPKPGDLSHPCYTVIVSYVISTWIRYQQTVIWYTQRIKDKCIHVHYYRGKVMIVD